MGHDITVGYDRIATALTWKPVTEDTADLRLSHRDTSSENVSTVAKTMGLSLKNLFTYDAPIRAASFKEVYRNCRNLTRLGLMGVEIDDEAVLEMISNMENLEELNLSFAQIYRPNPPYHFQKILEPSVQAILRNCKKLVRVDLSYSDITSDTIELIKQLENIKYLRVFFVQGIDKALQELEAARPDMEIVTGDTDIHHWDEKQFRNMVMESYCIGGLISEQDGVLKPTPDFPEEVLPFVSF